MGTYYCVNSPGTCDGSCGICPVGRDTSNDLTMAEAVAWEKEEIRLGFKSDGGSSEYYQLPTGSYELNDLIEHKNMSFALGNIFKACYRLGEKQGTDRDYDLNKIIYFANRLKEMT